MLLFDRKWYSLGPKSGLPVPRCGWSAEANRTCQVSPEEWRSSQSCRTSSKSKDPMAWEALACVTVYALHVMLNGHIDTPANPNWRLTKKKQLFSSGARALWPAHGHTAVEESGHNFTHNQRLPPALWWQRWPDGWGEQNRNEAAQWILCWIRAHRCAQTVNTNWHTFGNRTMSVVQWDNHRPLCFHIHLYKTPRLDPLTHFMIASFSKKN